MRTKITSYVNGNFELLECCADIAVFAEETDLFVDKLIFRNTSGDNWEVEVELLPLTFAIDKLDDLPF